MKQLSALALLISSVAVANQSATVTGTGTDPSEAKRDALHQASMRFCPSAVVNDREYRNEAMSRNNLTVYNGCIVKNYKVLNEQGSGKYYSVTINAEVVPNNLPSRIINQHPEWFYYDLSQHNDTVAQLVFKQENAISLIDEVFYDFPKNAFTLVQTPYKITYEGTQGYLNVDFKIYWNQNFLNALDDTFDIIKDKSGSIWKSEGYPIIVKRKYVFNNYLLPNQVRDHLENKRPVIRLRVLDDYNNEYVNICYQLRYWHNLYNTLQHDLTFNPGGQDQDPIKIALPKGVPYNAKFNMDVVPVSFCKAFY
jgi:hypothetical protein